MTGAIGLDEARVQLAAALRWAARLGLHEGICNHFSLMVPGADDRFLVNPHGIHWSQIRAGDLLIVDFEGRVIEGPGRLEETALFIHWRVHRALPRARCLLHTHMPYATALTSLRDQRLLMINQNSTRFYNRVAYDDCYNGLALDNGEGDRIAAVMGDKDVLFLGNHGVIVAGADVADAWDDLYYLERAAENQVLAMSTGRELNEIPGQIAQVAARQIVDTPQRGAAHLAALMAVLDRETPDYRARRGGGEEQNHRE